MTINRPWMSAPAWLHLVARCAWLIVVTMSAPAMADRAATEGDTLFAGDAVLELTLSADFSKLVRDLDEDASVYRPATLRLAGDVPTEPLSVEVKSRGDSRLDPDICRFVQLFVRFSDDTTGTPFAGQDVLPLTTHCRKNREHQQYVVQEYLLYRTYRLLTNKALRARLARVRYVDTSGRRGDTVSYAFFTEHFEYLAARLGCEIMEQTGFDARTATPYDAGLMEVFQYMIGNTDFSVVYQHNVTLLSCPPDGIIPLPYDFDSSGVVDARYAVPAPQVKIKSVRQRVYRGLCRSEVTFDAIFARLMDMRPAIYALYENQPGLSRGSLHSTLRYYDKFFKTLANPMSLQKKILDACY